MCSLLPCLCHALPALLPQSLSLSQDDRHDHLSLSICVNCLLLEAFLCCDRLMYVKCGSISLKTHCPHNLLSYALSPSSFFSSVSLSFPHPPYPTGNTHAALTTIFLCPHWQTGRAYDELAFTHHTHHPGGNGRGITTTRPTPQAGW